MKKRITVWAPEELIERIHNLLARSLIVAELSGRCREWVAAAPHLDCQHLVCGICGDFSDEL
jgi:hypothetical protein